MAASANVTAVGGTEFTPTYDANGNVVGTAPESAWNDSSGATGGGKSLIFPKPSYQMNVTPSDGARDIPDVALGASGDGPGFYIFMDPTQPPVTYGGTSVAAPMWAAISRLVSQTSRLAPPPAPNRRLGSMNSEIYKLGAAAKGLHDITSGDNSFGGVTGFLATSGYDQTTGWGTPADMTTFVNAYTTDICSQPHCAPIPGLSK
jgi:subtilase family serine protease